MNLLLYFVVRPDPVLTRPLPRWVSWIGHPVFRALLGLVAVVLIAWGVTLGDWGAFVAWAVAISTALIVATA